MTEEAPKVTERPAQTLTPRKRKAEKEPVIQADFGCLLGTVLFGAMAATGIYFGGELGQQVGPWVMTHAAEALPFLGGLANNRDLVKNLGAVTGALIGMVGVPITGLALLNVVTPNRQKKSR